MFIPRLKEAELVGVATLASRPCLLPNWHAESLVILRQLAKEEGQQEDCYLVVLSLPIGDQREELPILTTTHWGEALAAYAIGPDLLKRVEFYRQ